MYGKLLINDGYKFEVINGNFKPQMTDNENYFFGGWWTWYFKTYLSMVAHIHLGPFCFFGDRLIGWEFGLDYVSCNIVIIFIEKWGIEEGISGIKDSLDRIDDHMEKE